MAKELGLQLRSIQAHESGEYAPEKGNLERMAALLGFPVSFFWGDDLPLISEHAASFRSLSKMSAALRDSALGAGTIAFLLNDWIETRFDLPRADLPDLSDLAPEEAAAALRRIWDLGEAPVSNMVHLLEARGIRVYSLALDAKEVDAFSVWHGSQPFVFLNTVKSAEHSRFDAGHELAHLVLDRHSMLHGGAHGPEIERKANAFASAFLMPRSNVIAHCPRVPTIPNLIEAKRAWGVSLAALAYRLNQLGMFSEWTYRSLCIQMAKLGYRTSEPKPMPRETSQTLNKVFAWLREQGTLKGDIARELCLEPVEIEHLTFGLTMTGLTTTSQAVTESAAPKVRASAGILRVVK